VLGKNLIEKVRHLKKKKKMMMIMMAIMMMERIKYCNPRPVITISALAPA
jgi:hypothetical protein